MSPCSRRYNTRKLGLTKSDNINGEIVFDNLVSVLAILSYLKDKS